VATSLRSPSGVVEGQGGVPSPVRSPSYLLVAVKFFRNGGAQMFRNPHEGPATRRLTWLAFSARGCPVERPSWMVDEPLLSELAM
jgi:hypothetical protein